MTSRVRRITSIVALALYVSACAATTVRDRVRVSGLALSETVIALSQKESTLHQKGIIDQALHDRLDPIIDKVLFAARSYVRGVAEWKKDATGSEAVTQATAALQTVLRDISEIISTSSTMNPEARTALLSAILAIRAAITGAG